jgi:hypothetical protein
MARKSNTIPEDVLINASEETPAEETTTEETLIEETPVEEAPVEETAPPLLNEAVPEKEAPGHHSRDFFTPISE